MHKLLQQKSGFSLVELLVVVAIMGIIATLVITANIYYRKNVERSQIATAVQSYQGAVTSTTNEDKLVAPGFAEVKSCLSSSTDTSPCCLITQVTGTNLFYGCTNNTIIGNFVGYGLSYTASNVSSWVKKYISTTPPAALPKSSNAIACTTAIAATNDNLPCTNQEITLRSYIMADGSVKSYLEYFLPPTTNCESKDVATVTSFSSSMINVSYNNAKYTDRLTTGSAPFTFCMVGIR